VFFVFLVHTLIGGALMNICPVCSKTIQLKKYGKQNIFCSRKCSAQDKVNGAKIPCTRCCKEVYVPPSRKSKNIYCSQKCYRWIVRRETIKCFICENHKSIKSFAFDHAKTQKFFCSNRCKALGMKTGLVEWGFDRTQKPLSKDLRKRKQIKKIRKFIHRWVMEEHLGRELTPDEHVHHINEDPNDNRLENLMIVSKSEHGKIHKTKKK
jgi:HNH endonuclease